MSPRSGKGGMITKWLAGLRVTLGVVVVDSHRATSSYLFMSCVSFEGTRHL